MQLLLYNLPIINQWNQFHTVTKFPSPYLSRRSLLTAPWAMCVRVHTVRVCYGAFCSVVVLGLAGGTRLGVRSSASQPNAENVLPAPSNIFSNTLHSFLTCTTTSAQTTLSLSSPPLTPCCSASCSQTLYCSFRFLLMHKKFYNAPCCCLCILGVKRPQELQFQDVNENIISTYGGFKVYCHLHCASTENAGQNACKWETNICST